MNSKILTIYMLVSIIQNIHATDALNETNKSINNISNITTHLNEKTITNKHNIDNKADKNLENNNKNINDEFNIKRTMSNVWTIANNNSKCWLMAAWDATVPIFTQSNAKNPIRRTNYAEICKLLGWNKMDNVRSIHTPNDLSYNLQDNIMHRNKSLPKILSTDKRVLKVNPEAYKEYSLQDMKDYEFDKNNPPFIVVIEDQNEHKANRYDLQIDNKSMNLIGNRNDLISTIINYFNNKDLQDKINYLDELNNIGKDEKDRRNEILQLLSKMQDINYGGHYELAIAIILGLFPELKHFIGSGYKINDIKQEDPIMSLANNLNIKEEVWKCNYYKILEERNKALAINIKSKKYIYDQTNYNYDLQCKILDDIKALEENINENERKISAIKNQSYSKFSNETLNKLYNYDIDLNLKDNIDIPEVDNNKYVLSNKQYLILNTEKNINDVVNNYQYIKNAKGEQYELIGMFLTKKLHAVCFMKTGKSQKSWSGIDTAGGYINANDDRYNLKDIIYKEDPQSIKPINTPRMRKLAPFIKKDWLDESMYALCVDALNEEGKKYFLNLRTKATPYKQFKNDTSNNSYLAKVYKHYGYKPEYLLYKKI